MPDTPARFVALDIHKAYVVIGAVDATHAAILPPRRIALAQFSDGAEHHLRPTDQVVLETTINAWAFYDQLVPLVSRVVVANPAHIKLIAASMVKTDKRDTLVLARLLAANLIPAVWVPPPEVRELRALVTHRQRLLKQRTMAKNRLQSLLHQHNLTPPGADPFALSHQAWWEALEQRLPPSERLRSQQDRAVVTYLTTLIHTVEAELARVSQEEPWKAQVPFLIQLPGISVIGAMTVLAAIGDMLALPPPSTWWATRAWEPGSMPRDRCIVRAVSPERDAQNCAPSWSKQPGPVCARPPGGERATSSCSPACLLPKPSWRLPANSWW